VNVLKKILAHPAFSGIVALLRLAIAILDLLIKCAPTDVDVDTDPTDQHQNSKW
jgi:hypothetical protein